MRRIPFGTIALLGATLLGCGGKGPDHGSMVPLPPPPTPTFKCSDSQPQPPSAELTWRRSRRPGCSRKRA